MNQRMIASAVAVALAGSTGTTMFGTEAEAQQRAGALDEIVVTATKREESLQDVAVSVAVYSGDQLRQMAVDDISNLYVQTPNMAYSEAGGEAQIYIRGIGTNIFGVGVDPSVAVHQDGVYLGRTQMALNQFLDLERVEVLRGPQGILYGRNTTGGTINMISRMPTPEWEGYVGGQFGQWNRREVNAAVGGPVSDTVGIRLAGRWMKDDGYTSNINPDAGVDVDDNDILQLRAIAQFDPTDTVRFTLIADYSDFDSGNTSVRPRDNLGAAQVAGALPPPPFGQIRNDLDSFYEWENWGLTGTLEWDITPGIQLTSITGYRDYDSDFLFNTDGTEVDITRTNYEYSFEQFSQEIRIASTNDEGLRWIAGLYYLNEDKYGALGLIRAGGRPFLATAPTGSFIIPSNNETDAYAGFGQVTLPVSDTVDVSFGLRYSYEKKKDDTFVGAVFDLEGLRSPAEPAVFSTRQDSRTWSRWTPEVRIDWRPFDGQLYYFRASEGFKSGGFNALDANPSFDEEKLRAFEVGARTEWLDGLLRANAAAFYYDYEDLQVSTFIDNLTLTTNAAEATIWGAELELAARPVEQFDVFVTLSGLKAEYDEFLDRQGNNPDGSPRVLDLSGNRLPNAPRFKGSVRGVYEFPLPDGAAITVMGQYSYQARVWFTQFNEREVGQGGFGLLDARVAWLSGDGHWEAALFGRNLTSKDYYHTGVRFTSTSDAQLDPLQVGNALGYPAPGRSWGVSLTYSF